MDEINEQILTAKVAMLERLVRALYRDAFLKADDPLGAIDRFAERFTKRWESGLSSTSRDGTSFPDLVLLENLAKFFDDLRHDLEATLRSRGSR